MCPMPCQAVHRSAAVVVVINGDVRCRLRRRLSTISQFTSTHAGHTHTHAGHTTDYRDGMDGQWRTNGHHTLCIFFARAYYFIHSYGRFGSDGDGPTLVLGKLFLHYIVRGKLLVSDICYSTSVQSRTNQCDIHSHSCVFIRWQYLCASDVRLYVWRPYGYVGTRTFTLFTYNACVSVWE